MKSWLGHLSPCASGLSVPGRGEINHVWSGCFGTNRIIGNWHRCLRVMWRKRKKKFDQLLKNVLWTVNFYFIDPQNYLHIMRTFLNCIKSLARHTERVVGQTVRFKLEACLYNLAIVWYDILWLDLIINIHLKVEWNQNITRKFVAKNDPGIWFFPTPIGHSQTEVSAWIWSNRLRGEWYSFNY